MRFLKRLFTRKASREDKAIKALVEEFEKTLREEIQSESRSNVQSSGGYQMDTMRSVYPSVLTRLHPTYKAFAMGSDHLPHARTLPLIDETVCFPDGSSSGLGITDDSIILWCILKWEELHPGATKEAADNRRHYSQ